MFAVICYDFLQLVSVVASVFELLSFLKLQRVSPNLNDWSVIKRLYLSGHRTVECVVHFQRTNSGIQFDRCETSQRNVFIAVEKKTLLLL